MRKAIFFLTILSLMAVRAQSMVEYAAAAGAGSVGGAAGKPISKGVDTLFRKLETTLGKSGRIAAPKAEALKLVAPEPARPLPRVELGHAPALPIVRIAPAQPLTITRLTPAQPLPRLFTRRSPRTGKSLIQDVDALATPQTIVIGGAAPMRERLAAIEEGMTEAEVLSHLGQPSFQIRIDDGGDGTHILHYQGSGREPGAVRIVGGVVVAVERD